MLEITSPLIISLSLSAEVAKSYQFKVDVRGAETVIEYVLPKAPTRPQESRGVARVQWRRDLHTAEDVYKDARPSGGRQGAPGTHEQSVAAGTVITIDPPPGGSEAWAYILSQKYGALKIGPLPTTDFEWSLSKVDWEEQRRWFKNKNCASIEIREHKSAAEAAVVRAATVNDAKTVNALVAQIDALPANGREMIKMGPNASHVEVIFHCDGGPRTLELYNGRLKTPSTGFNMNASEAEKQAVHTIMNLLAAQGGRR